jgi:TPR repeat protein
MRVAAALPESLKSAAVARRAPPPAPDLAPPAVAAEGRNAGSAAKLEASVPPAAVAADGDAKRVAARQTHTAVAASPPAAGSQPDRKRGMAEQSPIVGRHPQKARPAAPGIDGPLTPSDLPAAPPGLPSRLSAWAGSLVDTESGLKALEESARNGDVSALWKLGRIYADGDGVPQNHLRAFEYFRRIAAASDVEDLRSAKARFVANAFVEVGRYYITGVANSDLKPDPVRAHQMFTYAAVYFADPDAQYELARMFLDGVGVARDQAQGARWLYQAAMKGQYDAQAKFGSLLFAGMGQVIPRDAAKGLMWLKIAMDTAPRAAAGSIAEIYEAASKQAGDEERAAAAVYYEQWRRSRKLPSESDKPATEAAPAAGARSPATRSQGPNGGDF